MVHKTSEYYAQFTSTISARSLTQWTEEITSAERRRLKDPCAMDIIGVQNADPEPISSDPNRLIGVGSRWLDLALSIEERQYVFCKLCSTYFTEILNRIDVRDRVKQLQKEPREESRLEVEQLRQSLTTDLLRLQSLRSNHIELTEPDYLEDEPDVDLFDNLDDEVVEADPSQTGQDQSNDERDADSDHSALPPERRPLHLPSHNANPHHSLRKAELTLRIKQATRYLTALREAIADKSFQYSHVMQSAPSKSVRTRSRSAITNISDRIAQYSRVYNRARAAMVRLGADERTLIKFKLLTRDDVKASTAIRDPNIPGSSTFRLSWIWETGPRLTGSAPDGMRECMISFAFYIIRPCIDTTEVQCVHWIRARAQKHRWEEELLLVKYEMQWTTRSFLHKAKKWQDRFEESDIDPGPKAYAARQSSQWRRMAFDADRQFRSANSEYISFFG